jgi:hypothetical protein
MSNTIYKYRIFCQTENNFVTTWDKTQPTVCPNNNSHTIDTSSITITEQIADNNVNIIQSQPGFTNGFYIVEGWTLVIPANSSAYKDVSWPYNTSIMTMNLQPSTDNIGDTVNAYAGPDTTIGIITQTLAQNVSVINVNSTVLQNIKLGYNVSIVNNTQNINMGDCISIDTVNSRITCNTVASESIAPGSYIKVSRHIIKNFTFTTNNIINLANKSVSSTAFPANTIARLVYKNNSNTEKTFVYNSEYVY